MRVGVEVGGQRWSLAGQYARERSGSFGHLMCRDYPGRIYLLASNLGKHREERQGQGCCPGNGEGIVTNFSWYLGSF